MRANRIVLVIATLMLVLSVAASGCGPKATPAPPEPTKTPEATATPEAAVTEEEVTITLWHMYLPEMGGAHTWFKDMIAAFEKEYPNIHIEEEITQSDPYLVKFQTAMQAGEAADAFQIHTGRWMEPYARDGKLLPLDKYLDEGGWRDSFMPAPVETLVIDGKTYGIPFAIRTVHFWYNKEVFDKYGLEPPETMAQLKEIIKTLRENGVTPIALGNKARWMGNFWVNYTWDRIGGYEAWKDAVGGQPTGFADPSLVEALALCQELVEMGAFTEGFNALGPMEVNNSLFTGETAMILNGSFFIDQVRSLAPEGFFENKLGYFNFPVIEGGKGSATNCHGGVSPAFAINAESPHPDEVAAFYRFITRPENMKELAKRANWVTVVKGTMPDDAAPILKDIANEVNSMERMLPYANLYMLPDVFQIYSDNTQAVLGLEITPEEAAANIVEAAKK